LSDLKKSVVQKNETQTDEEPLSITANIISTSEVLKMPLAIPDYQRPYVWNIANVEQMLSDIKNSMEQGKRKYRIGSIILHNNDIVDGQQRITTILLILCALRDIFKEIGNEADARSIDLRYLKNDTSDNRFRVRLKQTNHDAKSFSSTILTNVPPDVIL
jgi:uncharacterized protein with ParB-like and HNH nuclease domain